MFRRAQPGIATLLLGALLLASPCAVADQPANKSNPEQWHVHAAFSLRAVPIGTQVAAAAGRRWRLFDSDSLLLKGTYVEAGLTTSDSPSYFWGGGYVEAVPLAILQVRVAAQWMGYYGTFGYLDLPDDPDNPDWSLDALDGAASAGQPATGLLLDATATLRAKVGNVVAMVPAQFSYVDMNVDQPYFESTFDFLMAPTEQMWALRPMLGYVFVMKPWHTWVLAGLRWEHAQTVHTALSRDMPSVLALWKLPGALAGGTIQLATVGGYWLDHPNRQGTFYLAGQLSVDWTY